LGTRSSPTELLSKRAESDHATTHVVFYGTATSVYRGRCC